MLVAVPVLRLDHVQLAMPAGGEEQAISNWPDFAKPGRGRPRSATLVIRKDDGGIIGT